MATEKRYDLEVTLRFRVPFGDPKYSQARADDEARMIVDSVPQRYQPDGPYDFYDWWVRDLEIVKARQVVVPEKIQ